MHPVILAHVRCDRGAYDRFVRARVMGLVGLMAMVVVACGVADSGVTATRRREAGGGNTGGLFPDTTGVSPNDSTGNTGGNNTGDVRPLSDYQVIPGIVDFGANKPPQPYDGYVTTAFADMNAFWTETYPEVYGTPFEPLTGGIYAAYPSRTEPMPGCGRSESTYEDVYQNAFYCYLTDFIAYDDDAFIPGLVDIGPEAAVITLAHEYGHLIQTRGGQGDNPVVIKEQQADCFAGAWAAHLDSGGSDAIQFTDASIRIGLVGMINLRDPVDGNALNDPGAHGTGFDRVGAFQDGFEGGAIRCKTFPDEGRINKLIDIEWDSSDTNQGNLPLVDPNPDPANGPADIVTLFPNSLDLFWTDLAQKNGVPFTPPTFTGFPGDGPYPTCSTVTKWKKAVVFCPDDNVIYWDQDFALELSTQALTGDLSVGYLFSNAYSDAVQTALRSKREAEPRALFNDCLTGAWVAYLIPPIPADRVDTLQLSAGDLDEAIITAIGRSDPATDTNINGSAFEKVDAFRTGVLGGLNVCRDLG